MSQRRSHFSCSQMTWSDSGVPLVGLEKAAVGDVFVPALSSVAVLNCLRRESK